VPVPVLSIIMLLYCVQFYAWDAWEDLPSSWQLAAIDTSSEVLPWLGSHHRSLTVPAFFAYKDQLIRGQVANRAIHCGELIASVPVRRFLRASASKMKQLWWHPLVRNPAKKGLPNSEANAANFLLALTILHEVAILIECQQFDVDLLRPF